MDKCITAITSADNVSLITVDAMPSSTEAIAKLLDLVAEKEINVDMINLTPLVKSNTVTFSFTVSDSEMMNIVSILGEYKKTYPSIKTEIISNNTKICLYDPQMADMCGVGATVFDILSRNNIETRMITTSLEDISILVTDALADTAVQILTDNLLR